MSPLITYGVKKALGSVLGGMEAALGTTIYLLCDLEQVT